MTAERPNVVLIVSDTFRRDHIGAYGNDRILTPSLDRLALQSVVFDNHIAGSFPTMPCRADILTGRFSAAFMGWEPLSPTAVTLPAVLSDGGYLTVGVVDTPFFVRNGFGYDRGFDDFLWIRGQGDDSPDRLHERIDCRLTWKEESDRMVARTMSAAEGWLERHYSDAKPFFLYVDTWDPHEPWDAPDYFTGLYHEGYDGRLPTFPTYSKVSETGVSREELDISHAAYCGEVTMVDRWIGSLLTKLDVLGLAENTYVIFGSDHGFYFGEHDYFGKAECHAAADDDGSARHYEGGAGQEWVQEWVRENRHIAWMGQSPLYQEVTRIPLMMRGPGVVPGRRPALTTWTDVTATILDWTGLEPLQGSQGESLRHVIADAEQEHRPFVVTSWPLSFAEGYVTTAVDNQARQVVGYMSVTATTRDYSLLFGGPDQEPELYDLAADPGEANNVWNEKLDVGVPLLAQAVDFIEECGTPSEYVIPRREVLSAAQEIGKDAS